MYHFAIPHAPPKPKVLPPHPEIPLHHKTNAKVHHPTPTYNPPPSSAYTSYVLTCAIKPSHRQDHRVTSWHLGERTLASICGADAC